MEKNSQNFSMEEAMQLAKNPAAQQLVEALKSTNSQQLQEIVELAKAGDMKNAGKILNALLSSNEQAQGLIDKLGR